MGNVKNHLDPIPAVMPFKREPGSKRLKNVVALRVQEKMKRLKLALGIIAIQVKHWYFGLKV